MKIAIASDLSGFSLKEEVVDHLRAKEGIEVIDFGIPGADQPKPYFSQASLVCRAIQRGEAARGILICGTGQGMAIVANKHKGIYACVVDDIFSGERAKIVNDANVITMGGWITASFLAKEIVDAWLAVKFTQKMEFKHDFLADALEQVKAIESENFK